MEKTNEMTAASRSRARNQGRMARRRAEILTAAAEIFARQGYRQTDVQVVADRVGVGKGTVYRYFSTKEDLFLAAVDAGMKELTAAIDVAIGDEPNPLVRLDSAVRAYLRFFDENPGMVELLITERAEFRERKESTYFAYRREREEKNRHMCEEAMRDGYFRTVPVERVFDVINDVLYGAIFTNHFAGRRRAFEEQAADIVDILVHGIAAKKDPEDG